MVNIRKELNEALEKLVNKAPKKTVKKVVKESSKVAKKPLTEGAGAGYTIESTVEVTYVNSITPIKVLKTEDFFGVTQSLVLFYCNIDCQATDIEAESYMYGGKIEGNFLAKITAFTLWLDGEVDINDISKYEYESVMNNGTTLHLRTTVGGGYSHTTYSGELADIDKEKDVKDDDIYSVECKLDAVPEIIAYIDRLVTGETYFDIYNVYDENEELLNEFDNKDEAVEWAEDNKGVYVELDHYNELQSGDSEIVDSEVVWERDYTKQYNMGESLTEAKDDLTLTVKEWYTEANPDDDYGQFIDETVTFADIDNALNNHQDIYKVLGIGDSIIRERVFAKLADIKGVDYDDIFNKWLEECKKPIKESKDNKGKKRLNEKLIKRFTDEVTVDDSDVNSEDFLNELTNILGSKETYGGAILKVKDFKLNFDNRCFDDGVDSDIGCKFKALIEGDFGNNIDKRWVLFDFSDNPREYGLAWQGWWDEEDGEYFTVSEGGFSARTITTDILNAFMTKTEAGNLIYDTVEETVSEYVPVPENESLKEDKHGENPLKDLKSNIMEFESGDYVYVDYADGKIRAGGATNTGIIPDVEIDYDFDKTVDENLYDLYDAIIEKHPEYLETTED